MRLSFKRSDVFETIAEAAIRHGFMAVVLLSLGYLFWVYRGEGYTAGLILVLFVGGAVYFVRAVWVAWGARRVRLYKVRCPYCEAVIELTAPPDMDFTCTACVRLIPVVDHQVLSVSQVRCGFCNELNYYSDKTEVLLCENCNREVPIAVGGEVVARRKLPKGFAQEDDDQLYELVLVSDGGLKTEELIETLQQMLAMNRNQVKQMLSELPATMLTGITKRKAEILQAQLGLKDAVAEFRPIAGS